MRFARAIFILALLLCGLETVRLWFIAPDLLASHFNIRGNPDAFVPKPVFFGYQAQTVLVVIAASVAVQILPMILPVTWINIPNREYWLSPERRKATLLRLSSFGAALFTLILIMIQAAFELAVYANLQKPIVFAAQLMVPIIVGFIILTLLMVFWLARSFRLPA
jgi:uncharacterized membrane protein